MKKLVCLLLAFTIIFTLAACKKSEKEDGNLVAYRNEEGEIVTEYVTTTKADGKKDKDAEVKITIPLVLVDKQYHDDLDAYCKNNNYIDCKLNKKDQTVTITMKSMTYDFNLVKIGTQVMSNIGSVVDSGEYPYVQKLDSYSKNFDEIVMLVDGEGYKKDAQHSLLPYFLGECGMFYQIYTTANEYHCTVKIKDAKSGEIIDEQYYETDNTGKEY